MKKKTPTKTATRPRRATTPRTPADFAAKVLDTHQSNSQLYWEVLDQLSADDFVELENAVMANKEDITPHQGEFDAEEQREMATQEVCFMLGLEIGRRLGGAR